MGEHPSGTTHSESCWSWGPRHCECARVRVDALQGVLEELADAADQFESASRDHRSIVTNNRVLTAIDAARAAIAKATPSLPDLQHSNGE